MDVSPSLLRALLAVADSGGFSRAAEKLNSTQSTLSRQIRRLEHALGTTLVNRTNRQVTLSPDGRRLACYARRILALMDEARAVVGSGADGRFRFGIANGLPESWTTNVTCGLAEMLGNCAPYVRVDMSEPLRKAVEAGELDAALVAAVGNEANGQRDGLRRERLVWVTAPGVAVGYGTPVPVALPPAPCTHRRALQSACRSAGLEWREVFTTKSAGSLQAVVRCGFAVGPATRAAVGQGLQVVDNARLPSLGEEIYHLVYGPELAHRRRVGVERLARSVLVAN